MYNKEIKEAENILSKANSNNQNFLTGFEFSIFMQSLLIQDRHYVIDTGNYKNANRACAEILLCKIKKHPFIWKHFFTI